GGCDDPRPAQPLVVVGLLGERGHRPGHAHAVGAHRDRHRLAVLVECGQPEGPRVLLPQLEDVTELDAAGDLQRRAAPATPAAVADLDRADLAVRLEVAAADHVGRVLALGV